MSFTIYGLRIKGDIEVRYIGQTGKTLAERMHVALCKAKNDLRNHHGIVPYLSLWLLGNDVESVALTTAANKAEACAKEREMVELFARLGHRLFNRWLVPAKLRRGSRLSVGNILKLREGNNLPLAEPKLAGDFSHPCKRLEKQMRRIGAVNATGRTFDVEKPASELELGRLFNEDRYGLSHSYILTNRGLGANNSRRFLNSIKGFVSEPTA